MEGGRFFAVVMLLALAFAADFLLRAVVFFFLFSGADSVVPDETRLECRGRWRTPVLGVAASAIEPSVSMATSATSSILMRAVTIA